MRATLIALPIVALVCLSAQASGQTVRGRAVDEQTRRPIPDVDIAFSSESGVTVRDTVSGPDGFFEVRLEPGTYTVQASRIGYDPLELQIQVGMEEELVLPAFVLKPAVVQLDSIAVEAVSDRERAAVVGFTRASHVVSGARMAQLEQVGAKPINAIRDMPNVRVRWIPVFTTSSGRTITDYQCIESTRRIMSMERPRRPCQPAVLVLDGIAVGDPYDSLRSLNLQELESIEFLSPVEAGYRYGMGASAVGAVVVWTRGQGPHASADRNRNR